MDGFSGLINAQASSPNGYNAFSLMEKNQAPLPHESISMYEDNESSVMEGGNLNMWFSEFGGGMAMQLPEMEYYNLQTVEQSAGYVNNPLQFREAAECDDDSELLKAMANYGEGLVEALGSEVDRLETEIQRIVPGIRHVDIEAHNPSEPST